MSDKKKDGILYTAIVCMSAAIFVLIYGVKVLNPTYDDWLFSLMDLSQHYVGWKFFRTSAWNFPIGLIDTLSYPSKTSIIFTDSIPVFAVIFKVLSPLLPETFQYFGLWGILSFMLQGFFAGKILRKYSVGRLQALFGSIVFVIAPTVLEKMFRHTALGGQWIILATIYIFACHKDDYKKLVKTSAWWFVIGALIASMHLYFLPMCGIFVGGYILCSIIKDKRLRIVQFIPGVTFIVGLVGNTWLLGGFASGVNGDADGLGDYSFNLNGFFNSRGYSTVFKNLPDCFSGQYEGFAYLGLGIFVLLGLAFVYVVVQLIRKKNIFDKSKDFWMYGIVYVLMAIGLILFAASPVVTFNDNVLATYPYSSTLYHYWGYFRSSGRIIWPVCYMIFMAVIIYNSSFWKNKNRHVAEGIVIGCVLLQVFDLSGNLVSHKDVYDSVQYSSFIQDDIWSELSDVESVKHVVWTSNYFDSRHIVYMADYAYNNDWTMNIYYFARNISSKDYIDYSLANLSDENIYIFSMGDDLSYDLNYYEADGYIIGTVFELENEEEYIN